MGQNKHINPISSAPLAALAALVIFISCSGKEKPSLPPGFSVKLPLSAQQLSVPVRLDMPGLELDDRAAWEAVTPGGNDSSPGLPVQIPTVGPEAGIPVFLCSVARQGKFLLEKTAGGAGTFRFTDDDSLRLMLFENNKPVFGYVYGMHLAPGVPEDRRRASYLHPVWGLDGEVVSDDFPADHFHHRGIFWTWPQILVGEDSLSLWDIRGIHQKFESWLGRETGPVFARLGVRNGWYAGDRRVVEEKVWITAYSASAISRILDFELSWEATEEPVTLLGSPNIKGYGGFSLRYAPFADPVLTTSGGVQSDDSNRLPSPWADLSARFAGGGSFSGAAIFDHSRNISFPNGWCLRHYGFVGIAWPGIEPFVLEPGQPVVARYRVWLHRGDAQQGRVADAYRAYSETPELIFGL